MENDNQKRIKDIPALLFIIMMWRVLPAKTVAIFAGDKGESIAMGGVVVFCILVYLWYLVVRLDGRIPGGKALLIPLVGLILIGGSVLIHQNSWNTLYLTYFSRYVFFTLVFFLSVRDYEYLVELFCRFALITFVILGWQPILSSNVFASWMDYGFTLALPCTIGLYTLAKRHKRRIYTVIFFASSFMAIAFANRSTWICIALFIALYELIIEKGTVRKLGLLLTAILALFIVTYNFERILNWLIELNKKYNYNAHSLLKIRQLLSGTSLDIFMSGRQRISQLAMREIRATFPFGSGIGHFESTTGVYSHNIALDALLYWGIIGAFAFILLFIGVFKSIIKEDDYVVKSLKILMLCMWFPKLVFSGNFTYDLAFWVSLILIVVTPKNKLVPARTLQMKKQKE